MGGLDEIKKFPLPELQVWYLVSNRQCQFQYGRMRLFFSITIRLAPVLETAVLLEYKEYTSQKIPIVLGVLDEMNEFPLPELQA
jgi:hypothetical protein